MHHIPDQLLAWRMTTCPTKKWSVEMNRKTWVLQIYFFQSQLEDHGPFKSVNKLLGHPAHLSVFMNFVLSSSDPSSLVRTTIVIVRINLIGCLLLQLFYLLTDLYKEGNVKEMKKWAYEIHSTFLVPDAVSKAIC
jgi:Regulator of G protein signalling-like domain